MSLQPRPRFAPVEVPCGGEINTGHQRSSDEGAIVVEVRAYSREYPIPDKGQPLRKPTVRIKIDTGLIAYPAVERGNERKQDYNCLGKGEACGGRRNDNTIWESGDSVVASERIGEERVIPETR